MLEERSELVIAWYVYVLEGDNAVTWYIIDFYCITCNRTISKHFIFIRDCIYALCPIYFLLMVLIFYGYLYDTPRERITYHEALQGAFITSVDSDFKIALNYYFKYEILHLYGLCHDLNLCLSYLYLIGQVSIFI